MSSDLAVKSESHHQSEVNRLSVCNGKASRQAEADWARPSVWLFTKRKLATAEHLGSSGKLNVDLEADYRLPVTHRIPQN